MIKPQRRRNRSYQVLLLALSLWLSGCVNFLVHSPATSNHAFVAYWPPPKDGTGLRLAVKDLIDLKGTITTGRSKYLDRFGQPAQTDAACLAIARERNVIIVGKTNLSEFAVAPSGFNQYYGIPKNRLSRKLKLIHGGSSSGSAVAVQSGLADVALGTDPAALRRRLVWQAELEKIFTKGDFRNGAFWADAQRHGKTVDFIAIPTLQTLTPASPPLGSTAVFEAQMLSIQNTVPVNLAGNPALAVPIPIEDRAVPLTSLELIGPPLSEAGLLNAGRLVELSVNSSIDRPLVSKSSKP